MQLLLLLLLLLRLLPVAAAAAAVFADMAADLAAVAVASGCGDGVSWKTWRRRALLVQKKTMQRSIWHQ